MKDIIKAPGKLVLITWNDAWSPRGTWYRQPDEEDCEPLICHSVGWIMRENKSGVFLASSYAHSDYNTPAGDVSNTIFIPKGCIVKKRIIK